MSTETDPTTTRTGREPDVHECRYCGSTPAVRTSQIGFTSFAVFFRYTTWRGAMCRSCGEAVHRDAVAKTLGGVWWGIGVFAVWFFLILAAVKVRKVRALDLPRPTPGVAAPLPAPMEPGPVWYRRRGTLVAFCIGAGLWTLVALFVVAVVVSVALEG